MAAADVLKDFYIRYLKQNTDESDMNLCAKCLMMKDDIKVILNELKSTQEIVRILLDEIQSKPRDLRNEVNLSTCSSNTSVLKQYTSNGDANEWKEVQRKKSSTDQTKKDSSKLKNHTEHIPLSKNRFQPISDYEDVALQRSNGNENIKVKPLLVSKGGDR